MNFDFLEGWLIYPFSEAVHALQGVACGWLGTRAILKKEISDSIVALIFLIGFGYYEATEQWSIGDKAYQDFENFWLTAVATGIVYFVAHKLRRT